MGTPFTGGGLGCLRLLTSVLALGAFAATASADTIRGVTDTEIAIGTITDLSGVTAVQGVNNSDAVRMAFDEANEKGGVNGRKIKYIVEDNQYQVPRAVQAMNKLLNSDNVFMTIDDGGTPMNDANMPAQFAKNVPNMFPLTAARSMYEPYNRLKFGQFASYYDQMRAAVKYFAEQQRPQGVLRHLSGFRFRQGRPRRRRGRDQGDWAEGRRHHCAPADRYGLQRADRPSCMMPAVISIMMGTIVRDTNIIIQTVRKMSWNVDLVGQFASYDTAVATLPGGATEGFLLHDPGAVCLSGRSPPGGAGFRQALQGALWPRSELPWRGRLYRRASGADRV